MAFQLYVQPRSDYIADGILSAADSISGGMKERRERKEQRKQEAGMIDGFKKLVTADPELGKTLGITSDEDWDNFSPNQVKGMYDGIKLRAAAGQQKLQEMQMTEFERRVKSMEAEDAARNAETGFLQGAAFHRQHVDAPLSAETKARYDQFLANPQAQFAADYAAETGYAPGEKFMERYGPVAKEQPWEPSVVELGGTRALMTSPRSAVPLRDPEQPAQPRPYEVEVMLGKLRDPNTTEQERGFIQMRLEALGGARSGGSSSPWDMGSADGGQSPDFSGVNLRF